MNESGTDRLLALLNAEGRELMNLKFFPGEQARSGDVLLTAAYNALSAVEAGHSKRVVPGLGCEQVHIGDLVAQP